MPCYLLVVSVKLVYASLFITIGIAGFCCTLAFAEQVDNYGYDRTQEDWSCSNEFEIHCTNGSCKQIPDDERSTMELGFNSDGQFIVCSYTGCWVGTGEVVKAAPWLIIWKENVAWSSPTDEERPVDVLISFSAENKIATIHAGGLVQPYSCEESVRKKGPRIPIDAESGDDATG